VGPEVPIKEHSGWYDSFVVTVTFETVMLAVELAELGIAKY